ARAGAAPDQTWNEIALERDHVRRPGRLPLQRIRRHLFGPDARLCRPLAEVGDSEETESRASCRGAGQVSRGDPAEARPTNVVRMEMPALKDRNEDGELVRGIVPIDVVSRVGLRVAGSHRLG